MAAKKQINEMKEKISVELRFPTYVGYTDYFLSTPVSVQLRNDSAETVVLNVTAESAEGLLSAYETETEVPFES